MLCLQFSIEWTRISSFILYFLFYCFFLRFGVDEKNDEFFVPHLMNLMISISSIWIMRPGLYFLHAFLLSILSHKVRDECSVGVAVYAINGEIQQQWKSIYISLRRANATLWSISTHDRGMHTFRGVLSVCAERVSTIFAHFEMKQ